MSYNELPKCCDDPSCKDHAEKNELAFDDFIAICSSKIGSESTKQKMRENHADFSGNKNPAFRHDIDTQKVKDLKAQGMSVIKIAHLFKCNRATIYKRLKK